MGDSADIVISGGTIVDGTGAEPFTGDVAIKANKIVEVGKISYRGAEEIDARGQIVTPGFVDIHTHYDGQATWENTLTPSSNHGVTSVVMGNCGVGFAPCRPNDRDQLVKLMEGIEDVPEVVMAEGVPWAWETFPDYLDFLASRKYDIDIATQLPHSCLRVYVMGERGLNLEPANNEDLNEMRRLTEEALRVGALGVGTSRSIFHRFPDGRPVPSKDVGEAELDAIAAGMQDAGHGVLEVVFDFSKIEAEFEMIARISKRRNIPFTFTLFQWDASNRWKNVLDMLDVNVAEGVNAQAQIIGRPMGQYLGLNLSFNPFHLNPVYQKIAHLPLAERIAEMRKPETRENILIEVLQPETHPLQHYLTMYDSIFPIDGPLTYEPPMETSIGARARAMGVSPEELTYDIMLEDDGHRVLMLAYSNYIDGTLDNVLTMLENENTVLGLGDGGAHYGMICDASWPTSMLTYWTRDRKAGKRLSLEKTIHNMSQRPARTVGLNDRGVIAPGHRADLNVIDYDRLNLHPPTVHYDLPAGGRRIKQFADGYTATILAGTLTYREGQSTGELPGRLIRGSTQV